MSSASNVPPVGCNAIDHAREQRTVTGLAYGIPIVDRAVEPAYANLFDDKPWNNRFPTAPAASIFARGLQGFSRLSDADARDVRDALTLVAMFAGVPVNALAKPFQ